MQRYFDQLRNGPDITRENAIYNIIKMVNNGSVISDLELDKLYELLIIYENQINDSTFYSLIRTLWGKGFRIEKKVFNSLEDKLKTENIHADEIFLCLANATKNNPLVLKKDTWKVLNEKYASVYNENAKICCLELLNNFLKSTNRLNAEFDHIFNLINASFENESIDFIKNKLICIHNLIFCDTKYIEQGFIANFLFENLLKTNIGVNFQIVILDTISLSKQKICLSKLIERKETFIEKLELSLHLDERIIITNSIAILKFLTKKINYKFRHELKTFEILHTFLIDCHQSCNIYNDVIGLLENISKNGTSFQKAENIVSLLASSLTFHNKNSGVILNIIKNIAFNKEKIPSNALEHVLKLISDTNSKLSIINTSIEILTEIVKYDILTISDNILLNLSQILIDSNNESVCENILSLYNILIEKKLIKISAQLLEVLTNVMKNDYISKRAFELFEKIYDFKLTNEFVSSLVLDNLIYIYLNSRIESNRTNSFKYLTKFESILDKKFKDFLLIQESLTTFNKASENININIKLIRNILNDEQAVSNDQFEFLVQSISFMDVLNCRFLVKALHKLIVTKLKRIKNMNSIQNLANYLTIENDIETIEYIGEIFEIVSVFDYKFIDNNLQDKLFIKLDNFKSEKFESNVFNVVYNIINNCNDSYPNSILNFIQNQLKKFNTNPLLLKILSILPKKHNKTNDLKSIALLLKEFYFNSKCFKKRKILLNTLNCYINFVDKEVIKIIDAENDLFEMIEFHFKKQKCIDILKKLENMSIISVFAVELLFDFIICNRSYKHECLKVIVKHSQFISAKTFDKLIECMFDEQITDEITNIIINLRLFTSFEKNVFKHIKKCLNQKSLKICKNLEKICQYTKIDNSNDLYRGLMLIKDFDSKNLDEISLRLIKNIKLDNQDKFVQMIYLSFLEYSFIQSNKNINLRENIIKCLNHLVEKFRTPINFDEKFLYSLLVLVNFDKIDKKTAFELLLKISRKNFELKPFSVVLIETCISSDINNSFYKEINYILFEYAKQYHQLNDATIDILIKKATENKDLRKTSIKTLKIYSKNFQIFKKNHLENLESLACDSSNDLELSIDILTIIKYALIFQKDSIFKPSTKFINALNKILFYLPNDLKAMDVLSMLEGNNFFEIFSIIEILMSKQFHLQILQDYESHLWIREILVRELINNVPNKTLYSITVFNHYLASLERRNKFSKFSIKRDIFLEILIDKQRLLNLNLDDINEILFIIKEVNLDFINELCFNSINLIDELRYQFLYHKLNNFIEKTNELNSQKKILNDLNNLVFKSLNWNILFLNFFMNKIYSNDLNLNNLKTIADFIYENKLPLNLILECMNNHSLNFGSKDSEELGSCDLNEFLFKINVINDYKKYFGDDSNINNNDNKMNEGKFSVLQFMERLKLAKLATFLSDKFDLIDSGQETEHFRRNLDKIFDKILIYLKQFIQTDFEQPINNYKDTIVSLMYSLIDKKFIDDQVKKDLIYKKVSRILFYIFFGYNSNDYSFVELVKQLKDLNKMSPNILKYVDEKLEKDLNEIYKANKQKANLCDFTMSAIENYGIQEIKYWVSEYRKNLTRNQFFNFELIAILKRAMKIHFKHEVEVREIQMISFLLAIQNSGRLLQIKTGEGKSLVVAMIAAYFSLNNKLVDIVTSSSVLAKRDALNFKNFYEILDLKADYNDNIHDNQIDSFKDCYGKNIVYGEVSEFQFDILKQEYSFKNVRGKRPFEIVIVDEVDSMMIDENSKIARLSTHMPLIDQLQVFYFIIWRNLDLIDKQFVVIDDQLYFSKVAFEIKENGDLVFFHNKSTSENDSMNDTQKNIELQNEEKMLKIDSQLSFFLMIKDQLENSIKNYIFNPDCEIKIPKNYQNFLEEQLPKWIENALIAKYEYKLNHHYVIKNENGLSEIIPVDFENTGVIQTNQSWPDGLQQFIQIKENISLTQESLSTNYLSNIGFFKRYGKNIYGCTGTLGSEMAQSFLCRVYGVDRAIIPSYKCENFYELPSLIAQSKEEWILLCIESIRKETCVNKRAVLAICETVLDANLIRKNLIEKLKFDKSKIKMYTRDDNEETLTIKQTIDCGEIFVATNLAGRGTDIKCTDRVESNGGLHVCVGFLPINLRVEKQAFGRTSRQGNSGTAQLIFVCEKQKNASQIKKKRDSNEKEMLEYKENVELDQIIFKDELFKLFLDLVKKILIFDQKTFWLETDQDKKQYLSLTKNNLFLDNNDILNFNSVDIYKFKAVEEQWGLWLKKSIDVEVLTKEQFNQILKKFNKFKDTLLDNYIHDRITENCSYFILKANFILFESNQLDKKKACNKGINLYTKAIEIDKDFAIYAYAFRAYARLHLAKLEQYKKPYKEKVKKDLEDAFNCLNNCILKQLLTINTLAHDPGKKYENKNEVTELSNYIQSKCCVLNTLGKYLKKSLDEINNSETKSKEYDLDVECFKLQDIFSEINIEILNEFSSNGFYGLFDIKKYEPTPWAKIIIVGFIGLAQITAGFLILYYSPPLARLGVWLIEQGVDDIITAVKAAYEGKFSWTEYLISKGISIGVSLCCLGLSKLIRLNCLKPFFVKIKNIKFLKFLKKLGSIGQKSKKTNKVIFIKPIKIGLNALRNKVIKNVGMRLAMNNFEIISNNIHLQISHNLQQDIQKSILFELKNSPLVKLMFSYDIIFKSFYYENLFKRSILKIFSSNKLIEIAKQLSVNVLGQIHFGLKLTMVFLESIYGLYEYKTFIGKYKEEFSKCLIYLIEILKFQTLLKDIRLCDENQANEICEHLKTKKILLTNNCLFSKSTTTDILKEITFLDEKNKNNIIKLINSILDNQNRIHEQYLIKLADELSSQVGNFMASIINKTMISPIGQMMISSAIDFLMKDWDEELLRDLESYQIFTEQKKINENLNQIYQKGNNFIETIERSNHFFKFFKNIFSSDEGKKQIEQLDKKVQKCIEKINEKSAKIIDKYDYSAKAYKKINKVIDYELGNLRNYCVEKIFNFISLNCGHKADITEISDYFEKTSQVIHLGSNNRIDSAEFFGSLSADSRKTDQILIYSGRNLPNISNSSFFVNNLNSSVTLFNSFGDSRLFYFQDQFFNVLNGLKHAKIYLANRIYKLINYEKLITNYTLQLQERGFSSELPILDAKDFQLMHNVLNLNTPSYITMLHFFQLIYNKAPLKDIVKLGEDIIKYLKIEIAINEKKLRDYSIETNIHDNQFKKNLENCLKQAKDHTTGLNQQFYKELSDINLKQGYEELHKRLRKIEKFDFSLDQLIQKLKLTDNLNDDDVRFITNSFKELDNEKVYSFYYSQLNFNDELNERTIIKKTLTAATLLFLQINSLRTNLDKTLSKINKIEQIGLFENETLNGFVKKSEPVIHLNKNILDSWELIMNVIIHEASHLGANTDDVIYLFNPLSLHIPSIFMVHNADSIAGASSK